MRKSIKLLLLGLSMLSFGGVCVATSSVVVKPAVVVYAEEEQPQETTQEEQPKSDKESTSKPSQIAVDVATFLNTPLGYTILGTISSLIVFATIFSKTKVGKKVFRLLIAKIDEERIKREAVEEALKEQEKRYKELEKVYTDELYRIGKAIVLIGSKSRNPEIKEELKLLTVLVNELESESKNNG